ncbi:MAG: hypothetical protein MJA29_07755 [Candidatus Omnitrophica bacterium]|nr:hypothetical protein [Candidatus Omnitrophota bacterium]
MTETVDGTFLLKPHSSNNDKRVSRPLTLPEFIQAFTVYKNVMCEYYPYRRPELDAYERDIVDMAVKYGGTLFYEYHRLFASRAAAHLEKTNIKVDWSIRDRNLFANIFSGSKANACAVCGSIAHSTHYCPCTADSGSSRQTHNTSRQPNFYTAGNRTVDAQGRKRVFVNGKEVCNNYNSQLGCKRQRCDFLHSCSACHGSHPQYLCSANQTKSYATSSAPPAKSERPERTPSAVKTTSQNNLPTTGHNAPNSNKNPAGIKQ